MEAAKILVVDENALTRTNITKALSSLTDIQFELFETDSLSKWMGALGKPTPHIIIISADLLKNEQELEAFNFLSLRKPLFITILVGQVKSLDFINASIFDYLITPYTESDILRVGHAALTCFCFLQNNYSNYERSFKLKNNRVIHELKTPVNAINGYLKMLKQAQLGGNLHDYQQIIDRSILRVDKLNDLINNYLHLGSLSESNKTTNITLFDLCKLTRSIIGNIEYLCIQKNVQIFVHSNKALNLTACQFHFEIILSNLLLNAVKNNIQNGTVNVEFIDGEHLIIRVSNTTVVESHLKIVKLFNENKNLRNTINKIPGSGLSIIEQLVDIYDGEFILETATELNVTLSVKLPKPIRIIDKKEPYA